MQIYIMRHGQAEMMAASDKERPLTSFGRVESEKMAAYLVGLGVSFDAVWVSPYLRAQQTWQAVSTFFPDAVKQQTVKSLVPSGSARNCVNDILALQSTGVKSLLIVSHLPLVGYLVGELAPAAGVPAFSPSTVAQLELDQSCFAYLQQLITVSQFSNKINLS